MKKNEIKLNKTTCAILLSCTLATTSLAGCMKESSGMKCGEVSAITSLSEQLNNSVLESLKSITEINTFEKVEAFAKRLSEESGITISYYEFEPNRIDIQGEIPYDYSRELSDDFYSGLNSIIRVCDIHQISFYDLDGYFDFSKIDFSNVSTLWFHNLSDRVDLSKVDFSNVSELSFSNFSEWFDFSKVDFSNVSKLSFSNLNGSYDFSKLEFCNTTSLTFKNCNGVIDFPNTTQKYEDIVFYDTSLKIATNVLSNCDVSEAFVRWDEVEESTGSLKPLLEYLVAKDVSTRTFYVQRDCKDYTGITEEEFTLLSQVNTTDLHITASGFQEPLNLDLTLHKNIRNFSLNAYHASDVMNGKLETTNGELGTIKIDSNHEISCYFSDADITSNTSFSLPEFSSIKLVSLDCRDTSAFRDLRNIQYLYFNEVPLMDCDEDYDVIIYSSDINYDPPQEVVECYHNYDEVLEELDRRYGAAKVKKYAELG